MLKRHTVSILTFLALLTLTLLAIQPLTLNQLPRSADGLLHLYRIITLDDALTRDATLYPRYASSLVYGYGTPLFNYYSPVPYYPAVGLHHLGMTYLSAWLLLLATYTFIAAVGAYRLGKLWTNRIGGLFTAAAYIYSPYFLFDIVGRGTLTEVAALALLPFTLWAITRLARSGTVFDMALTALTTALFIPLHNIITLHGGVWLTVYGLLVWWLAGHRWRTLLLMALAGGLGLGMTAFFLLPALGETGFVKIRAITEALDFIDVTRTLRPLTDILALPHTADPTQLQQPVPITLSWLQLLLVMGCGAWAFFRRGTSPELTNRWLRIRSGVLFFALTLLLMVLLNLPQSAVIWRSIPGLDFTQFAWRTLGIGSLALAMLSGMSVAHLVAWVEKEVTPAKLPRKGMLVFGVLLALNLLYGMAWLVTIYVTPATNSVLDTQAHERATHELALSSYSEYLPTWTQPTSLDPEKLRPYFEQNQPVVRLTPPEGVTLTDADWRGTAATLALTADNPTKLVFDWLYFPGWAAHFTNDPSAALPLTVAPDENGFVSVEISAGTHTLEIALLPTRLQQTAWLITFVSLAVWGLVFVIFTVRRAKSDSAPESLAVYLPYLAVTLIVSIGVLGFKLLIVDQTPNLWRSARFSAEAFNTRQANFNDEIALLTTTTPSSVESGANARLTLFWRLSAAPLSVDYSSIVELRDSAGIVVANGGSFMPAGLATSNWLPDYYVAEELDFLVQAGTPPGIYTLEVGLYDPTTQQRLNIINAVGNPEDVKYPFAEIEVLRPATQPVLPADYQTLDASLGLVVAEDMLPAEASVGAELPLTLTWVALQTPLPAESFRLVWQCDACADSDAVTSARLPLFSSSLAWQTGDVWDGHYLVYVPADLSSASYTVAVEALDAAGNGLGERATIGTIDITAPERIYELPERLQALDEAWANGIHLRGYNVDASVRILTLYWQTEQPLNQSLRLFVHVLDGDSIVAQSDGIPVNWTRPTTGWATDEVIITEHAFDVDLTGYQLRVGWYDPRTNTRVLLADGTDSFVIDAP